jgi:hypothetical protein
VVGVGLANDIISDVEHSLLNKITLLDASGIATKTPGGVDKDINEIFVAGVFEGCFRAILLLKTLS